MEVFWQRERVRALKEASGDLDCVGVKKWSSMENREEEEEWEQEDEEEANQYDHELNHGLIVHPNLSHFTLHSFYLSVQLPRVLAKEETFVSRDDLCFFYLMKLLCLGF